MINTTYIDSPLQDSTYNKNYHKSTRNNELFCSEGLNTWKNRYLQKMNSGLSLNNSSFDTDYNDKKESIISSYDSQKTIKAASNDIDKPVKSIITNQQNENILRKVEIQCTKCNSKADAMKQLDKKLAIQAEYIKMIEEQLLLANQTKIVMDQTIKFINEENEFVINYNQKLVEKLKYMIRSNIELKTNNNKVIINKLNHNINSLRSKNQILESRVNNLTSQLDLKSKLLNGQNININTSSNSNSGSLVRSKLSSLTYSNSGENNIINNLNLNIKNLHLKLLNYKQLCTKLTHLLEQTYYSNSNDSGNNDHSSLTYLKQFNREMKNIIHSN